MIKILVVEDSEFCLRNLTGLLGGWPVEHEMCVACDGQYACEILGIDTGTEPEMDPDLVLLDLRTPRMSGLEFLRLVRADLRYETLPVIVLTSSDSPTDRDQTTALKVADYLVKGSSSTQTISTIERALFQNYKAKKRQPAASAKPEEPTNELF